MSCSSTDSLHPDAHDGFVATLLALSLLLAGCTTISRNLAAPAAEPARADLIVALGGGRGERTATALALYRQGFAPRILLTGLPASAPSAPSGEAHARVRLLLDGGVPRDAILADTESANSCEEAIATRALMARHGWRHALVVSDPPHLRRLDWAWSRVFAGSGMRYRLVAADSPWWTQQAWRDERASAFVVSEVLKFAYYVLVRGCGVGSVGGSRVSP